MKNLLLLNLSLFFQQTFACVCGTVPLMDRVANAEFIAIAKILRITPYEENPNLHNIEVEIVDPFKGENTPNLKIYSALNSSCAFYTPENTSWLIFAIEN